MQAIVASTILILLPLCFHRAEPEESSIKRSTLKVFAYFIPLGTGFMFLEIALIQKFILFLHIHCMQLLQYSVQFRFLLELAVVGLSGLIPRKTVPLGSAIRWLPLFRLL